LSRLCAGGSVLGVRAFYKKGFIGTIKRVIRADASMCVIEMAVICFDSILYPV
jgi:hypothetical protein